MTTGEKGLALIKQFEGCSLKAYKLPGERYYTIGYGHSFDSAITAGTVWTKAQAEAQLKKDLEKFERYVAADVPHKLNQHQFDALVSYCYNRGRGGLRQLVGACSCLEDYPDNIVKYWGSATRYQAGLVRRRKAERKLFMTPCGDSSIMDYQEQLNASYGLHIAEDGIWGTETRKATWIGIQIELNADGAGLAVDGDPGQLTCSALAKATLRRGHQGNMVYLLQGLLLGPGYYSGAMDGDFGVKTEAAVMAFQLDNGLAVDGIVGPKTWAELAA